MSTHQRSGGGVGTCIHLPARQVARLALALVLAGCLVLVGCPRKEETPPEAGTGGNAPIQIKTTPVMPPGFVGVFLIPEADVDQHGNPVNKKGIFPMDGSPCWPAELWLKEPCIEFVLIPAGEFDMGDSDPSRTPREMPVHKVTFTKPFYMGKYEVTQGQWEAVMGSNPSNFKNAGKNAPVESVSWNDCASYILHLKVEILFQPSSRDIALFRLPSEAEWEYACRAGTRTRFCSGDADEDLDRVGWYEANAGSSTHSVGKKAPNAWGLYDIHGNVWEWCEDVCHIDYQGAPGDGTAWLQGGDGSFRVLRGGSWDYGARPCRCTDPYGSVQQSTDRCFGFRLAVSPRPQ